MYEKITLIGNLGVDPEVKFSAEGKPYAKLFLITNRVKGGEEVKTVWNATVFGRFAEIAGQYLRKGSRVLVEGNMEPDDRGNPRVWQRKDGTWAASYELVAHYMKMVGGGRDESSGGGYTPDDDDDEIPF